MKVLSSPFARWILLRWILLAFLLTGCTSLRPCQTFKRPDPRACPAAGTWIPTNAPGMIWPGKF